MNIKILLIAGALLAFCASTYADTPLPSSYPHVKARQLWDKATLPGASKFNANELSIDLGTTYTTPGSTTIFQPKGGHGVWGVDMGADYWIKRYAGLGLDAGIKNTHQANELIFDHTDVRVDLRLPLDTGTGNSFLSYFAVQGSVGEGKDFQNGSFRTIFEGDLVARLTPVVGIKGGFRKVFETGEHNNENQIIIEGELSF